MTFRRAYNVYIPYIFHLSHDCYVNFLVVLQNGEFLNLRNDVLIVGQPYLVYTKTIEST